MYLQIDQLTDLNSGLSSKECLERRKGLAMKYSLTASHTLLEMVKLPNYTCFGLFLEDELVGISAGWTTVRIYCGKQLELDNVIIDSTLQSQGLGHYFINEIKDWSAQNEYKSLGLNTYVQNPRSHKFYFNEGFKILGFHFEKKVQL